jgi:Flp pilus assembly protein TadG
MERREAGARRARGDAGATAVEFGLLLPLLMLILMLIIDLGRAFSTQITLTQASREGVRVWALTKNSGQATSATQAAATGSIKDPTNIVVTTTACTNGLATDLTATYSFKFTQGTGWLLSHFKPGTTANTWAMSSKATMRCNG